MSKTRELAELNREFNTSTTMHVETYRARHAEIVARYSNQDEATREADKTADEDAKFVTFGVLARLAADLNEKFAAVGKIARLVEQKIAEKPSILAVDAAVKMGVDKALDPLATRVANVEFKVAAWALGNADAQIEARYIRRIEALEARIRTLENK